MNQNITLPEMSNSFEDIADAINNYYLQRFDFLPSIFNRHHLSKKDTIKIIEENGYKIIQSEENYGDKETIKRIYQKDTIILILQCIYGDFLYGSYFKVSAYFPEICLSEIKEMFDKFTKIKKIPKKNDDNTFRLGLLLPNATGLIVKFFDINYSPVSLSNYSKSVSTNYNKILSKLNEGQKGLYLFTGEPGTGKTTFLRKLAFEIKSKNFIFINADNAELLGDPQLISTLMNNRDSILVIEDGESSIATRKENTERSKFTSNLLNLTDGLISDILQIQVIITLNWAKENIDPAFRRAGRLQFEQEFEPLDVISSNLWLKKNKSKQNVVTATKLCDLYSII